MSEEIDDVYRRKKPDWFSPQKFGPTGSAAVDKAINLHSNETASIVDIIIEKTSPQLKDHLATIANEEIKKSTMKFREEVTANMKKELDIDRRLTRMEENMRNIKFLYPIMFACMVAVFLAIINNLIK